MDWRETTGGRAKAGKDGITFGVYDLDTLPEWRFMAPGEAASMEPYHGTAKWSGKQAPPAIGSRVNVTMNGFGPATVRGYFLEAGFLGVYVTPDAGPAWWLKQRKERGETAADLAKQFGGPMVFGLEIE